MGESDFFVKTRIELSIARISELLGTGVFGNQGVFQESALTEVMVKLHDLLQTLNQLGHRVSFTEDVADGDVTDLVSRVRNAVCHSGSDAHLLDREHQIKFTFNVAYGRCNLMTLNGREITSDYEDDVCFFFGEQKIYLNRHIVKALQEAKVKYGELYPTPGGPN